MNRTKLYILALLQIAFYILVYYFAYYLSLTAISISMTMLIVFCLPAFFVAYMGYSTIFPYLHGLYKSIFKKDHSYLEILVRYRGNNFKKQFWMGLYALTLISFMDLVLYFAVELGMSGKLPPIPGMTIKKTMPLSLAKQIFNLLVIMTYIINFIVYIFEGKSIFYFLEKRLKKN